jgi:Uma2 family endonuclease
MASSSWESEMERLNIDDYFAGPETTRRMELEYGVVREPPAPNYGHQAVVTGLTVLLHEHVTQHALGRVCVSPVDVVLDAERGLVVQPDIVFVSTARTDIIRDRIWGPPDLVIEVLSPSTRAHDAVVKVEWYARYGVRECWLVDAHASTVEVVSFCEGGTTRRVFKGRARVRSVVLPAWSTAAEQHFP